MATFLHPPSPRPSPPLCQYRLENPILSAKSWQHVCLTHAGVAIIDHCSLASFPSLIPMRHRRRSEAEMGAFRYASVDSLLLPLPNANGAISKLISGDFPSPKQYPRPSFLLSLPPSLPCCRAVCPVVRLSCDFRSSSPLAVALGTAFSPSLPLPLLPPERLPLRRLRARRRDGHLPALPGRYCPLSFSLPLPAVCVRCPPFRQSPALPLALGALSSSTIPEM